MTLPSPESPPIGPRERLGLVGATSLSDAELLALVLGTGTPREPVSQLAQRLVDEHGGLSGLTRLGLGELASLRGLGYGKACRLVGALELGRRTLAAPITRGTRIGSSRDVELALRARLATLEVEQFLVMPLDARNRALSVARVGLGTTTYCPVSPADVFRTVLREAGVGVVVAHNHPSGDPRPSSEDVELTRRLVTAGETLGVRLLDHVILAREGYFSFLDAGLLASMRGADAHTPVAKSEVAARASA